MSIFSYSRNRVLALVLVMGAVLAVAAACSDSGGDTTAGETPAVGETPVSDETPAAHEDDSEGVTAVEIKMVPPIAFDTDELTIAADTDVTVTADNTEVAVPHNFAVYTSKDAAESGEEALATTEICSGSCVDAATVNLSAGEFFFRCDVHPAQMTGTLTVQ